MKQKISKLREKMSLYNIALDIGVSESTLYNYVNDYKKVSSKSIEKIREYFKEEKK